MRRFVTSSALAACLLPTIANAFVQITYTRPVPVVAQRPALPHSYDAVGNLLAASNAVAQNAFSGTDALGWTDSSSYEGSEYTVSHVAATVARESLITTATIGIGTAA